MSQVEACIEQALTFEENFGHTGSSALASACTDSVKARVVLLHVVTGALGAIEMDTPYTQ